MSNNVTRCRTLGLYLLFIIIHTHTANVRATATIAIASTYYCLAIAENNSSIVVVVAVVKHSCSNKMKAKQSNQEKGTRRRQSRNHLPFRLTSSKMIRLKSHKLPASAHSHKRPLSLLLGKLGFSLKNLQRKYKMLKQNTAKTSIFLKISKNMIFKDSDPGILFPEYRLFSKVNKTQ